MTEPYYSDEAGAVVLHHGDLRDVLPTMPDASVDAVVTDPPYELGFMGRGWDASGIAYDPDAWREVLRVLKPGGHLLAFGGTRTWHRMVVAIEDAGFEIRDEIAWLYGSGFPKSLDVSKAIDKAKGVEGGFGGPKSAAHAGWINRGAMRGNDGHAGWQSHWMADAEAVDRNAREYLPGSDEAKTYKGWGTALKPAHEPICVARKPLEGTVAANVLEHGTGALNIDGCRIAGAPRTTHADGNRVTVVAASGHLPGKRPHGPTPAPPGRWPANVVLDEHAAAMLDEQSGERRSAGDYPGEATPSGIFGELPQGALYDDTGGASRFFYIAKAASHERPRVDGIAHPTVKPVALMRWLVRLVTPPGGTVLDPFAGSGTTAEACIVEGFRCVLVEQDEAHLPLIVQRLSKPIQPTMFGGAS